MEFAVENVDQLLKYVVSGSSGIQGKIEILGKPA